MVGRTCTFMMVDNESPRLAQWDQFRFEERWHRVNCTENLGGECKATDLYKNNGWDWRTVDCTWKSPKTEEPSPTTGAQSLKKVVY
ncbi:hypothetical protein O9K51_06076 [Purpureocillium lavendulum]|uniref:Uncharacterized protein n=1 Tax=Purpureocillium lavendulum TaxID=1247861 RepID=A0AB34FNN9_9HYPO|nr:hypothetical protein O9K51_06076 [Purpureocillium lavendulum]